MCHTRVMPNTQAHGAQHPQSPVFILTTSRSGSTLVRFILDSHPDLACPPEIARTLPEGLLRLMGYQRGSYAIGYADDMREPLDWLYDSTAFMSDFYEYRRAARKRLKATKSYVPRTESFAGPNTLADK